jgi:hypothetical protein
LTATVILQLLTQYAINFWNRDFFNAVERKDGAELLTEALRFVPLAAASLALAVFSVWARMTLQRKMARMAPAHWPKQVRMEPTCSLTTMRQNAAAAAERSLPGKLVPAEVDH